MERLKWRMATPHVPTSSLSALVMKKLFGILCTNLSALPERPFEETLQAMDKASMHKKGSKVQENRENTALGGVQLDLTMDGLDSPGNVTRHSTNDAVIERPEPGQPNEDAITPHDFSHPVDRIAASGSAREQVESSRLMHVDNEPSETQRPATLFSLCQTITKVLEITTVTIPSFPSRTLKHFRYIAFRKCSHSTIHPPRLSLCGCTTMRMVLRHKLQQT